MSPVRLDIITYTPTEYYHCTHCEVVWQNAGMGPKIHAEQRQSSLPPDLAAEFSELAHHVAELKEQYGEHLDVRLIDAASPEGFLASLRHRVHRYPAFIVSGKEKVVGPDFERVAAAVRSRLDLGQAPSTVERAVDLGGEVRRDHQPHAHPEGG